MEPSVEPSPELLRNAADGQAEALNALLDGVRDPIRRMIRARMDRRMAGRVDASDIVQDVLMEATRRLPDYIRGPAMPFRLWLRQIAQDRMIDLHRRHRAQRRDVTREQTGAPAGWDDASSLDLAARLVDSELTPAAHAIRQELQRRFYSALDELREDDREVVVMRHVEQMGNNEVAEALGLTPAAAGMRYLRALRRLKEVLGETPSQAE
ncbi:RNA polymerase sigma factor CnrH [Caulifigura coniformis]|uniref:RNA polymerase sigma factor CnrH n=1 Tax=Caulifigura coniformis TaxID=2527983 RepID=A0A517SGH4_9PLAN|nr:sigma-70 family RNA polymerase sigma factor [Caulifigura coniformis]QDT55221.1 RNA polymerase sigma factor CnrH [Caulifigura coniformis]